MERLTNKREAWAQRKNYENRIANGYPRNIPEERFLRLAAYEDTGLMPEEIAARRWIPVTEQLPENDARVLTFCKDRVIHDMKWSWVQDEWFDKVSGGSYFESFVTHWMPLPEAPEVE